MRLFLASGSISLNARDTFPRAVNSKKIWGPNSQPMQTCSITNLNKNLEDEQIGFVCIQFFTYKLLTYYLIIRSHHPGYYVSQSSSQQELNSDNIYNRKVSHLFGCGLFFHLIKFVVKFYFIFVFNC